MADGVRIAIVGATGAVGTVFLKVLEEHKNFKVSDVKLLASGRSAGKRLKELGHMAQPALQQRLKTNPPLEERQRIEALLKALVETPFPLTPEGLRDVRAVAVLARVNSPQARQFLEELSRGVEAAPLTAAAQAALAQ